MIIIIVIIGHTGSTVPHKATKLGNCGFCFPLFFSRHSLSSDDCVEDQMEHYQNCFCCVPQFRHDHAKILCVLFACFFLNWG